MPRIVITAQVEDLVKWEEGFRTHGDLFRSQTVSGPIGIATNEGNEVALSASIQRPRYVHEHLGLSRDGRGHGPRGVKRRP